MAKIENTIECIELLMDKMNKNGIASLVIKDDDFEIKIETICGKTTAPIMGSYIGTQQQFSVQPSQDAPQTAITPKGNVVKSPIVGTYYSAPSPNDADFVKLGQSVKKGDVIFIIESMKVMSEIKSEFDGIVTVINVKTAEAVEYDQPIMIIE